MKKVLNISIICILLIGFSVNGQSFDTLAKKPFNADETSTDVISGSYLGNVPNKKIDKENSKICKKRGHIQSGFSTTTLLYCDPKILDSDCHTSLHYDWCNTTSYQCARCNDYISENGFEIIEWRSKYCKH